MPIKTHPIVIIGGGFAGLRAALDLDKRFGHLPDVPIYLIDFSPYHIYTPNLYELASSETPRVAAIPFDDILEGTNVRFIQEKVIKIDPELKEVLTEYRRLRYEDLILALGSQTREVKRAKNEADKLLSYRTIHDVLTIRTNITNCIKRAAGLTKNQCHNHIIIAGGGPTGVEFAAGLSHFVRSETERYGISSKGAHITLVEAGTSILSRLEPDVRKRVRRYLRSLGISVVEHTIMTSKGHQRLALHGQVLPLRTIIWTVGVEPHRLLHSIPGLRHDDQGRVLVDASLQSIDVPRVWIIGDGAAVADAGMAEAAIWHGRHVAKSIAAVRQGSIAPAYQPRRCQVILPLSHSYGVACLNGKVIDGRMVIWYKQYIVLRYFLSILSLPKAIALWRSRGQVMSANDKLSYALPSAAPSHN